MADFAFSFPVRDPIDLTLTLTVDGDPFDLAAFLAAGGTATFRAELDTGSSVRKVFQTTRIDASSNVATIHVLTGEVTKQGTYSATLTAGDETWEGTVTAGAPGSDLVVTAAGVSTSPSLPDATAGARGAIRLAGDFSGTATSPTVVATHLAAPLPEAQGGTGALSLSSATVLSPGGGTARTLSEISGDVDTLKTTPNAGTVAARDAAIAAQAETEALLASQGTAARKVLANRISDATITDVRLVPFEIETPTTVNRVSGYVGVTDTTGKLVEIGIYDRTYVRLATTEAREVPAVGEFEFAIPETTLARARYYFGIATNSATAQVGVNVYAGAVTATAAFPLPATAANPAPTAAAVAGGVYAKDLPATQGLFSFTEPVATTIRVYGGTGIGGTGQTIWGYNVDGNMVSTTDGGGTWIVRMPMPGFFALGESMVDVVDDGTNLYALGNKLTVFKSSGRVIASTWANITCPTDPGLRHAVAAGRAYGLAVWNGHVYVAEYSNAPNEFAPDGPRILRYNIAAGTWAKSAEFVGARHFHSFYDQGDANLWVSVGDANYTGIGIHRLAQAGIGAGDGGTDSWVAWTSPTSPNTNHYPVDFIVSATPRTYNGQTAPAGIYGTSDRPGKHVLYAKTTGAVGAFNLSAQVFQRAGGPAGETVRSLVQDTDTGNLYWWTAETTEQAIWVSPPPYTQSVKLKDFPASPILWLTRAVYQNGYVMMFNQRFRVEKFVGQ